uniref:FBD domain-containing protein n=1 Tax=Romanomermis culicivorax TaxID=13658 RepID=A0A915HJP9_ROMCU
MRLPQLKNLSLYILNEDSDLPYHRIKNDLHFVSLQNIYVNCEGSESHAKLVAFLLSHSPMLKEFSLKASDRNLAFYGILLDKFPLYDQIEIFTIHGVLGYEHMIFWLTVEKYLLSSKMDKNLEFSRFSHFEEG